MPKKQNYSNLITDLSSLIEQGRKTAVRYVNTTLVVTYWMIGRRIVKYEQKGKERAEYGKSLLKRISDDLTPRFGKGFTERNLEHMRQFYLTYSEISHTVCAELIPISQTMFGIVETLSKKFPLSWSHYRLLMRIDEPFKREFYEAECIKGNWSVRQLDRQIQSMLYERTALSKRKLAVIEKAHQKPIKLKPEDEIKDPYILELGIGFTFVARQKRITIEGTHYRFDLLFYHRTLRCLVAIDLKIGEFTHADAGQMNLYINYLKDKEKLLGENDPVGIILCSDKKKTVAEYALGGISNKIFASKYKLQLPDPEVLKTEIEYEKQRLLEMKIVEKK